MARKPISGGIAKVRAKRITAKQRVARKKNIAIARSHRKKASVALRGKKGTYMSGQKISVGGVKGTIIPSKGKQAYVFRAKGSVAKAKRLGFKRDYFDRRLSGIDEKFIKIL